jgi:hypothetical protein
VERDHGRVAADETIASLRAMLAPDLPGTARMIEVARLKARAAIALGDCFAVATAAAHDVVLLAGDPEILRARGLALPRRGSAELSRRTAAATAGFEIRPSRAV